MTEKETAKYISKYLSLGLVEKPSYTKEIEGRVVVEQGKSIQFIEGIYETSDTDEIKFLENHPNFGTIFVRVEEGDLNKVREERFKNLETREAELRAKEEELLNKEKALSEGESVPKGRPGRPRKEVEEETPSF